MAKDKKTKLELTWVGKDAQIRPEPRILIEQTDKSYGDPEFENMLIHGDNLLALKSLESKFAGQVKCIYIDPPYNTGNAFEHYDDGVEHSIWLSLMRDRLEILRNLLADDGSIWISIDSIEHAYLKVLCDEVFGRQNFVDEIVWQRAYAPINLKKTISRSHDTILVYAKAFSQTFTLNKLPRSDEANARYKNPDNDPRGVWQSDNLSVGPAVQSNIYEIETPTGRKCLPPAGYSWRVSKDKFAEMVADNRIWFGEDGKNTPRIKRFLTEVKDGIVATSWWTREDCGDNQEAKREIKAMFPDKKNPFDTPKPERLIERVLTLGSNPGDLVLDSFLGSGTTAAVAHKMGRRWIGIELTDNAYDYCAPRMQKVIDGTDAGGITKSVGWTGGGGFKFYELASSLLVMDAEGNLVISKEYNADMLAEAMCNLMGYKYEPDRATFWKQGRGTEKNYIFTTTMVMTAQYLEEIQRTLGDNTLTICCSAFIGNPKAFPNITIKRIPQSVLEKCEWNSPGYPLPTREDFTDEDFEFEDGE